MLLPLPLLEADVLEAEVLEELPEVGCAPLLWPWP
jgi:hypothetical protein